jgi:hypothetical protein
MILIKDAHDFIRMQIKKNKLGFVSPEDIDRAVNRGVSDWMSAVVYKYKQSGKYEYDHLLVKRTTYPVTASNYVQVLPTDYTEALTIYVNNNGTLIEGTVYSWDDFLEVKNSKILTPDLSYPAATIYVEDVSGVATGKIEFAPIPISGTTTFTFVYMRRPVTAVYKYIVTNGNITYVNENSVNIDLDDRYFSDILSRALFYLGISLHDADIAGIEGAKDNLQKNDER